LRDAPMFKLFSQLPRCDSDLWAHIDKLKVMSKDAEHKELLAHLYGCLSILDSKSSSLLSFNSIIIAVFSLFLTSENSLGLRGGIFLAVGMISIIISCFFLLWVVWVHWSTTNDLTDLGVHAFNLPKVRKSRTLQYRIAWYFAVTSILSLSVFLAGRVIKYFNLN
jgi:drug/metabolite transporter superfamily protein YnfA